MVPTLTFFLVLLAGGYALPDRIVGGEPTTIDQYPSIVAVESQGIFTGVWSQSCAANILTSRWVLSAAHCFDGLFYQPELRRIRAGSSYRNTGGQVVGIVQEYNHPTWGTEGNDGDISVVKLQSPLEFNPVVAAGILISQGFEIPDNTPVIHAGWGTTSSGGSQSEVLRDVTVNTINSEMCAWRYANLLQRPLLVTDNMICVGILDEGGKDACQGDSGGPLYLRDANDRMFLVGIVSWGYGCADPTFPGVNTKVASFTNWVVNTANDNN